MTILGQPMAPTAGEQSISSAGPYAYITNRDSNILSVIDTTKYIVTATVKVGSNPWGVAVNPDGTKVYVSSEKDETVSVIDTATNNVTATVKVEGCTHYGVAVSPDGKKVYVTSADNNTVSIIDTGTNTVIAMIKVGGWPQGVTVSPDGKIVYVVNESGTVSVIDTATNNVTATVKMEKDPVGVTVSPDGKKVYVTNYGSDSVSVIDTATNNVIATVKVGSAPWGIAINPAGTKVYVANIASNTISVINTETLSVTATVNVGSCPHGVTVNPAGTEVYVANLFSNTVSVIDTFSNNVKATVNVGSGPIAFGQFIVPFSSHTESPDITLAHYDKDVLDINWTNPGSYTDFIVELHDTAGTMHYNQPATGTSAKISEKLDKDKTYIVSVSAIIDGTPGPRSSEVTLIVIPPIISLLQYCHENDQGRLETSWEPVTGAELYIASVYATDGSSKQNIPSITTSCKLESTLDQSKQYKTTICATANNGIVIGPVSREFTAIIKAPNINLLQYTLINGEGKLNTSWGEVQGAELYIKSVYTVDGSFKQNIPSTTTSCTLESTLDQTKQYKTTVCATANDGIVIGPSSAELSAIIKAPDINLLQYSLENDQGRLDTSWEAVSGADLYIVSLCTDGGSFKQNIPSTTTSYKLESTLDQTKQYKTTVCATANDGIVIGPSSAELSAVIACPGNVNLNYTGQNLRSDWTISTSLQGKQFNCELYKDNAKLADQVTGDSHVSFNYSLDAGAIYTSHVRGENGVVKGPWTKPAQGPYAENTTYNYDTVSRLKSIISNNTITVTCNMDNSGNILSIQNNQA